MCSTAQHTHTRHHLVLAPQGEELPLLIVLFLFSKQNSISKHRRVGVCVCVFGGALQVRYRWFGRFKHRREEEEEQSKAIVFAANSQQQQHKTIKKKKTPTNKQSLSVLYYHRFSAKPCSLAQFIAIGSLETISQLPLVDPT